MPGLRTIVFSSARNLRLLAINYLITDGTCKVGGKGFSTQVNKKKALGNGHQFSIFQLLKVLNNRKSDKSKNE